MTSPMRARNLFRPGVSFTKLGGVDTGGAVSSVQQALQTLTQAPGEVRALLSAYRDELASADRATRADQNLSPAGTAQRMAALRQDIQSRWHAAAQALAGQLRAASATIDTAANSAIPPAAGGVEAMLARQAAWARARSLLDAGWSADQLVSEATDPEQLAMLSDELPTWLRVVGNSDNAQGYLQNCILRRYADLAPSSVQAGALHALLASLPLEAGVEPLVQHMLAETAGQAGPGGFMSAGIAADSARQKAQMAITGSPMSEPVTHRQADGSVVVGPTAQQMRIQTGSE